MKECARPYYLHNGEVKECSTFDERLVHKGTSLYEVVRLMDGKFLFLEDHIARLFNSLEMAGIPSLLSTEEIHESLRILLQKNNIDKGNVKIVMNLQEDGTKHFLAYFVFHRYPSPRDYAKGVKVITYPFERIEPNKKIWRPEFRRHVSDKLYNAGAFEALLMNSEKCITEASKANVFALHQDRVITPPERVILPGITRQYVLEICHELSIPVTLEKIPFDRIPDLEGFFLTGTSLHVLPVSRVDDISIPVGHPVINSLMKKFQMVVHKHFN
jgi:branched-chain amino acid aminotransferase